MGVDALLKKLNEYEDRGGRGKVRDVWSDVITRSPLFDERTTEVLRMARRDKFATTAGVLVVFDGWESGRWVVDDTSVEAVMVRLAAAAARVRELDAQRDAAARERDAIVHELWHLGAERKQIAAVAQMGRARIYDIGGAAD